MNIRFIILLIFAFTLPCQLSLAQETLPPANVENLTRLGMHQAFEKHYAQALETLNKAHSLAPNDVEIQLQIARIKSWNGDNAGAARDIAAILEAHPENNEAYLVRGRLHYYQSQLAEAEKDFSTVLKEEPHNKEALDGLADVMKARQSNTDVKWSFTGGHEYSSFSRKKQSDWHSSYMQGNYALTPKSVIHARIEEAERFNLTDKYAEGGIDYRFAPKVGGYLYAGGTPDPDFLAKWQMAAGGNLGVTDSTFHMGSTALTFDTRFNQYTTNYVYNLNPGVEQYITDDLWLTAKMINTIEEGGNHLQGWLGRADSQISPAVRIYGLVSHAPETVSGETVTTLSYAGGIAFRVTQNAELHIDYTYDDREHSYIRNSVNAAVTFTF